MATGTSTILNLDHFAALPARLELSTHVVVVPESLRQGLATYHSYSSSIEDMTGRFSAAYGKLGNLPTLIGGIQGVAEELLFERATQLAVDLMNLDVPEADPEKLLVSWIEQGGFNAFEQALEEIVEQYSAIQDSEEARDQIRALRQANRFQVVGGGFGFSGAAKGMLAAGAVNAATGLVTGVFNLTGKAISAIGNAIKEGKIYDAGRAPLVQAFRMATLMLYETYIDMLASHTGMAVKGHSVIVTHAQKARKLFDNSVSLQGLSDEKRLSLLCESLAYDPRELRFYKALLPHLGRDDSDLERLLAFSRTYCPSLATTPEIFGQFVEQLTEALIEGVADRIARAEDRINACFSEEGQQQLVGQVAHKLKEKAKPLGYEGCVVLLERAQARPMLANQGLEEALDASHREHFEPALLKALDELDVEKARGVLSDLRRTLGEATFAQLLTQQAPKLLSATKARDKDPEARRAMFEAFVGFGLAEEDIRRGEALFAQEHEALKAREILGGKTGEPIEDSNEGLGKDARKFKEYALFLDALHHRARGSFIETPGYEFKDERLIRKAWQWVGINSFDYLLRSLAFIATVFLLGVLISYGVLGEKSPALGVASLGVVAAMGVAATFRWQSRRDAKRASLRFDERYLRMMRPRVDASIVLLTDDKKESLDLTAASRYLFVPGWQHYLVVGAYSLPLLFIPVAGWILFLVAMLLAWGRRIQAKKSYMKLLEVVKLS